MKIACALLFCFFLTSFSVLVYEGEKTALQKLYDCNGGSGWRQKENWMIGDPCDDGWLGVACDPSNSQVVRLSLNDNLLNGTLPADLDAMTALTFLDLGNNKLTGSLPDTWGGMTLETLNLGNNSLTGPLPGSWSGMNSLQILNLLHNDVEGTLPESWGSPNSMSSLKYLNLANNHLIGTLPSTWRQMPSISLIYLRGNQLNGSLPESWSSMTKLLHLDLSNNSKLNGTLPSSWSSLTDLQSLNLGLNNLTGTLPDSWSGIHSLRSLLLGSNKLNGTLPNSWSELINLKVLLFSDNNLSGTLPDLWHRMTGLEELYLNSNQLNGILPGAWRGLNNLKILNLSRNQLNGTLPESVTTIGSATTSFIMPNLRELNLSENLFNGTLPASWDQMTGLEILNLGKNQLSGTLPESWSNMIELQPSTSSSLNSNLMQPRDALPSTLNRKISSLSLGNNLLTGSIPSSWFGTLIQTSISLSSNYLTEFSEDPPSIFWTVSNNAFQCPEPTWCSQGSTGTNCECDYRVSLNKFYLESNGANWINATGWNYSTIVESTNPCADWAGITCNSDKQILKISLPNNNLSGNLSLLVYIPTLDYLDLSGNQLSGNIADLLSNATALNSRNLTYLDLSNNQFTGSLPEYWCDDTHAFKLLSLANNDFTGDLQNCSYLLNGTINLSSNKLGSSIILEGTPNALDISANSFECPLPSWCEVQPNRCDSCPSVSSTPTHTPSSSSTKTLSATATPSTSLSSSSSSTETPSSTPSSTSTLISHSSALSPTISSLVISSNSNSPATPSTTPSLSNSGSSTPTRDSTTTPTTSSTISILEFPSSSPSAPSNSLTISSSGSLSSTISAFTVVASTITPMSTISALALPPIELELTKTPSSQLSASNSATRTNIVSPSPSATLAVSSSAGTAYQQIIIDGNVVEAVAPLSPMDDYVIRITPGDEDAIRQIPTEYTALGVADITLYDSFGVPVQPTYPIEVCFGVASKVDSGDLSKSCLASYSNEKRNWNCDDKCVRRKGNSLCGKASHLTNFAILLGGGGGGNNGCESDDRNYILGSPFNDSMLMISCLAFCCICLMLAAFVSHIPRVKKWLRGGRAHIRKQDYDIKEY